MLLLFHVPPWLDGSSVVALVIGDPSEVAALGEGTEAVVVDEE